MTDSRGDHGFAVAPQRLGGGRSGGGGPGRLAILIVLIAALGVVGVAWAGPRLGQRPNLDLGYLATPTPGASPTSGATATARPGSLTEAATPLPTLTRPDGVTLDGHLAVVTDVFRILDLATGTTVEGPPILRGLDALFPSPEGTGWTCICFIDGGPAGRELGMTISRIDDAGSQTTINPASGPGSPSDVRVGFGQLFDLDMAGDRRHGVIIISSETEPSAGWTFAVQTIDATRGVIGRATSLGEIHLPPAPRPSGVPSAQPGDPSADDATYIEGPSVRMAPDGRSAYAWVAARRFGPDGASIASAPAAWRLTFDDQGAITNIEDAPALRNLASCGFAGFLSNDRFVQACPSSGTDPAVPDAATLSVRVIDGDGGIETSAELPSAGGFGGVPLIDRANELLYDWDPVARTLARIDLATLAVVVTTFDPRFGATAGVTTGGTRTPDWHVADSILGRSSFHFLLGEPGGSRLYLVAMESTMGAFSSQRSLGVYVADAGTLALVDKWAPAANYVLLANPGPGLVAAIARPGVDVDGQPAPWLGSITIHESATGAILGRYAVFAEDTGAFIIEPGGP